VPRRTSPWARDRFAQSRVARLATVGHDGAPHLVPVVFAVLGETIVTAVDHKPKSTARLRRLDNIVAEPRVSLLADAYDEDWSQLWWARADGRARVHASYDVSPLVAKYPQYADRPPDGPVVAVAITRWSAWSATEGAPGRPG
jgi:PPOX class probable F420-dependent enzyme